MRAYLIRHAASSGPGAEAPLTPQGAAQAEALVPALAALGAGPLYTSPYARARATMAPYAAASGAKLTVLEDLRECRLAPAPRDDWQDLLRAAFEDADRAVPGGESHRDLLARWGRALAVVAQGGGVPALVGHGTMTAALFHSVDPGFGFAGWQGLRNPDLFEITLAGGRITGFVRRELEIWS